MRGEFELTERQRAVVDAQATRSIRVLGGPGSGKTTTLVERVARLVEQPGWTPDNVLVLASTRTAATRLRDELALRCGVTASGPMARTVSSVAFHLVQAELGRAVTLLTGAEHDALISELLVGEIEDGTGEYWPESLGRELRGLRGFRTELREFIMRTEEFGVSIDQLRALADRHNRPEWHAVARFLDAAALPQASAHPDQFDAAALTAFAARILSDSGSLGGLEAVRAVLVDDAQDATRASVSLLRSWASRGVAITVFGDPDVASNGFRGGGVDVVGSFASELALDDVLEVTLTDRFRGTPAHRHALARVVAAIGTRGVSGHREPISAPDWPTDGPDWARIVSPSATTEARAIANELRTRHLIDGVPWGELAVIVRSARLAHSLESQLSRFGVPTRRSVSRQVLRDDEGARWLLDAASIAYRGGAAATGDPRDLDAELLRLLASPLANLTAIELRQLKLAIRSANMSLSSALADPVALDLIGLPVTRRAAAAAHTLAAAVRVAQAGSVEDVLWTLWSDSAALQSWAREAPGRGAVAEHANAALDAVVALFAAAKRFVERRPREHGSVFLEEQLGSAVPEDLVLGERDSNTVTVGTPSQFVGRSCDTVVIASLNDGVWPNLRPRFSLLHADDLIASVTGSEPISNAVAERAEVRSDEYRLFALALSRASRRVVLSAHLGDESAPSVLFGETESLEPQRTEPTRLRDLAGLMRRRLVRAVAAGRSSATEAAVLRRLTEAGVPGADPGEWYGLREWSTTEPLEDLDADGARVRVSPSTIEKIEKSPLSWFVDQFAPAPPSDAQATGTIVHAALEHLGDRDEVTVNDFVAEVLPQLEALPLPADWMREQRERQVRTMLTRLCQYLESSRAKGRRFVAAEAPFRLEFGPVVLSGVIDRVERDTDGALYVVDLKTSKYPVSKQDAAVSAQLECYQLAIHEGAIEGVESAPSAGAALLYVRSATQTPTLRTQDPLGSERAEEVRARVLAAAERMSDAAFADFDDIDENGIAGARRYRIQVVPGVSA